MCLGPTPLGSQAAWEIEAVLAIEGSARPAAEWALLSLLRVVSNAETCPGAGHTATPGGRW